MKDSIFAVECIEDYFDDVEKYQANKQKVYDSTLQQYGSLVPLIRGKTNPEALKILKNCMCCARHQVNKPFSPDHMDELEDELESGEKNKKQKVDYEFNAIMKSYFKNEKCKCNCRQLSRWLCRGGNMCHYVGNI
jgi:hypothetical protein